MTTLIALLIWIAMPAPAPPRPVDFARDVRPILDRCQPCHFAGGKVYDKLPFDRPETVVRLGTRLFTRIKDEKKRDVIRQFLAEAEGRRQKAEGRR